MKRAKSAGMETAMRWSLRQQILMPVIGVVLTTVLVVSALNAWVASTAARRRLEGQLRDLTATLSSSNFPLENHVLQQMRGLTAADYVVMEISGRAVAASDESFLTIAEQLGNHPAALDLSAPVAIGNRRFFHSALPLDRRSIGQGQFLLHVSSSRRSGSRLYARRTVGRNADHRHFDRPAVSGRASGA
jgi:hypothetical protein